MARGITQALFSQTDVDSQQVVQFPHLLNGCKVYGVRTTNTKISLSVEIYTDTLKRIKELQKKGQRYSGIKWVYGKVNSLEKDGISWYKWYHDANTNDKKDEGEDWVSNPPLSKISKEDLYGVRDSYKLSNTISVWFGQEEDFEPALYWVEPFLVHPELHFSKQPKGIFIIPVDYPKPYEAWISSRNILFDTDIYTSLPATAEESKKYPLYYNDTLELDITTFLIPENKIITTEIIEEGNESNILYTATSQVETTRVERFSYQDETLSEYMNSVFGTANNTILLDLEKKPKDQQKKQSRTFKVIIRYFPIGDFLRSLGFPKVTDTFLPFSWSATDNKSDTGNIPVSPARTRELTGYITIQYEDTEFLIIQRKEEVNQVVQKPGEKLSAPGCDPCHYTRITAQEYKEATFEKEKGRAVTVFNEDKIPYPAVQPRIDIIAGDTSPAFLKLKADLMTEGSCKNNVHTHGGKQVFFFDEELPAKKQGIQVLSVEEKEIRLSLPYVYIKDKKVANTVSTFPFNYFCLPKVKAQPHVLLIETCRYRNDVLMNVYPDIEWWINVKYNAKNPLYVYKTPNYGYRTGRNTNYNRSVNGRYQADRGKTYDSSYECDFEVGYKYNGQEHKIGTEEGIPLLNAVLFFIDAYKIIRQYLFADETEDEETDIGNGTAPVRVRDDRDPSSRLMTARYADRKSKGIPVKITVDRPSFSGGVYSHFIRSSTQENQVGYAYSLNFSASPLFKVTGKLDLLFYAQFIPYIGQALKAINKVVEGINFLTLGAVKIDYYLNIAASVSVNLDWTGLEYHSIDGWATKKRIGVKTEIKFWLEAGVNLKADFKGIGSGEAEGAMTGTASVDILLTYDNVNNTSDSEVDFKGLKVKIWLKASVKVKKRRGEGPPPEPNTKPDYVKDLIKGMKKPWKINIM